MLKHRRTAASYRNHLNASILGRDSARRMARALEALDEQNDYIRDEVARLWALYREMEADIDDVIGSALADGWDHDDIDAEAV